MWSCQSNPEWGEGEDGCVVGETGDVREGLGFGDGWMGQVSCVFFEERR